MDFLMGLLAAAEPFLQEAIILFAVGILYKLLGGFVARDTLHSAVRTGVEEVFDMLEDGRITKEELIQRAIRYTKTSSPGAVKKTGATDTVLESIARAKLNEVSRKPAPPVLTPGEMR